MRRPPTPRRIVIVDDSTGFQRAAQQHIDTIDGLEVAGCADDGPEGLMSVARLKPDVVLVDIHMPGMNGFEFVRQLRQMANPPAVVLASLHVDADTHGEARRLGVAAVLAKSEFVEGLPAAIDMALGSCPERGEPR